MVVVETITVTEAEHRNELYSRGKVLDIQIQSSTKNILNETTTETVNTIFIDVWGMC